MPFRVSILTRPEGRVQQSSLAPASHRRLFQSSPVPKDGCNLREVAEGVLGFFGVSILTRPEGRVQHAGKESSGGSAGVVSILTRPEGRVQLPASYLVAGTVYVSILTRPEGRVQLQHYV